MKTITLNGKDYNVDWNLAAMMSMERAQAQLEDVGITPIMSSVLTMWAAMNGGDETFDKTPQWLLREVGKDMSAWNQACKSVAEEIADFHSLNEALGNNKEKDQDTADDSKKK